MHTDTNLLIGIMLISSIFHGIAGWWCAYMKYKYSLQTYQIFLALFVFSSLIYSAFMYLLQNQISLLSVFAATACSVAFFAIPIFMEYPRLVVSQMFHTHIRPLTDLEAKQAEYMVKASGEFHDLSGNNAATKSLHLNLLTPEKYAEQTLTEAAIGSAYWTGFSGAYGIVIGNILSQ